MINTLNEITGDTPFGRLDLSMIRSHVPQDILEFWEIVLGSPAIYSLRFTDDRILVNDLHINYGDRERTTRKIALYFFALWSEQGKTDEHSTQTTAKRENHPETNASASGFKGSVWVDNHQQSEAEQNYDPF